MKCGESVGGVIFVSRGATPIGIATHEDQCYYFISPNRSDTVLVDYQFNEVGRVGRVRPGAHSAVSSQGSPQELFAFFGPLLVTEVYAGKIRVLQFKPGSTENLSKFKNNIQYYAGLVRLSDTRYLAVGLKAYMFGTLEGSTVTGEGSVIDAPWSGLPATGTAVYIDKSGKLALFGVTSEGLTLFTLEGEQFEKSEVLVSGSKVNAVYVSPGEKNTYLTANVDGHIHVFRIGQGLSFEKVYENDSPPDPYAMAVPDADLLVDRKLNMYDLSTGSELETPFITQFADILTTCCDILLIAKILNKYSGDLFVGAFKPREFKEPVKADIKMGALGEMFVGVGAGGEVLFIPTS